MRRDHPAPTPAEPASLAIALFLGLLAGPVWLSVGPQRMAHSPLVSGAALVVILLIALRGGRRWLFDRTVRLRTLWFLFISGLNLVVATGEMVAGGHAFDHPGRIAAWAAAGIILFGGGRLLTLRAHGPTRRLSTDLALRASIVGASKGRPAQLVLNDGRRVQPVVLHYRYLAGARRGFTANNVVDVRPITEGAG